MLDVRRSRLVTYYLTYVLVEGRSVICELGRRELKGSHIQFPIDSEGLVQPAFDSLVRTASLKPSDRNVRGLCWLSDQNLLRYSIQLIQMIVASVKLSQNSLLAESSVWICKYPAPVYMLLARPLDP